MPKNTQTTRNGPRCRNGHDWRMSFDGRFYYCYYCPAEWYSRDGTDSAPPQESYKTYPNYQTWADGLDGLDNLPKGDSNTMPSKEFDDFLEGDDNEQAGTKESWMKVRDMLYEPIRVTRANVREEDDTYNPGKTRHVAYVHFHFLDDLSETPFVFSSSAKAILNTVNRAVTDNEFPFDAAVIEILSAEPFNGYFPLRFTSLGKLPEAVEAMEASRTLVSPATSTPQADLAAEVASLPSKVRAAATAGKPSVALPEVPGVWPKASTGPAAQTTSTRTPRTPRNLAQRGN